MKNKKLWLIFPAAAVFALAVLLAVGLILRPSPPDGLAVDDLGVLYWEGDDRATSYTVDIDGKIYTTDVWYMDIFDITDEYKTYTVTVTAKGFLGFKRANTISYDLPALPEDAFVFGLRDDEKSFIVALNPDVAVSGKVIIPSSHDGKPVTGIASQGFNSRQDLTSVFIPDSVTSISVSAFSGDKSLQRVRFSQSLTSIGNAAFRNCSALKEVTLPEGLLEIGGDAFRNCTSLTHVTIPDSTQLVSPNAFGGCEISFIVSKDVRCLDDALKGTLYITYDYVTANVEPGIVRGSHILLASSFVGEGADKYLDSLVFTKCGEAEIYPQPPIAPYRKGYKFLGWSTKRDGDKVTYTMEDLMLSYDTDSWPTSPSYSLICAKVPYGTTLYPVWEKIKTYDK